MGFGDSRGTKFAVYSLIEKTAQCANAAARPVSCLDESHTFAGFAQAMCRNQPRQARAYDQNRFTACRRGAHNRRT